MVFAVAADTGSSLSLAERAQLFGMIEACLWLGLLSGPFIGGWLATHFGTQQAFFWGAGCSFVCLLVVLCGFKETLEPSRRARITFMRATPFGAVWLLFSERSSAKLGLLCLFSFTAQVGSTTIQPLFLPYVIAGWKTVETGLVQSIMYGSSSLGLFLALPVLTQRFKLSAKQIILLANVWQAASWAAFGAVTSPALVFGITACFFLNGIW